MFLSFIIPVYNAEQYLRECLESLLAQNLSHAEYEIICVNDGSTDASLKMLNEYTTEYCNIHLIDKKNEGVSEARNVGLEKAAGKYV